ncbi:MAG: IS1595 family transposase [Terracidiphilus sp.]|jgi:transposase-like protein
MNLFSLAKQFPTEDAATEYWIATRWPDGVRCVRCDHSTVYRIQTIGKTGKPSLIFECGKCALHFSPTAGTLFHDSHLPLQKWFAAIALMCEGKKGISANQMKRHLGTTYKTAWFLCHRIRKAMSDDSIDPLGSEGQVVEIDESFVGGKVSGTTNTEAKRRKVKVLGIAERGGRVHLKKIKNLKLETIGPILEATISPNAAAIHTDGSTRYRNMLTQGKHIRGNHTQEMKANQPISNQTIEGAFSLFKRGVVGSYHKLGVEHMDAYLGEFCWRYNRRRQQAEMFDSALSNMTREPLPYAKLKGGDNPF